MTERLKNAAQHSKQHTTTDTANTDTTFYNHINDSIKLELQQLTINLVLKTFFWLEIF